MESGITNKIVDLKIYEISTGNLILTQTCPESMISKIVSTWVYQQPKPRNYNVVISSKLSSADITSADVTNVEKITNYIPEIT